jgi:Antibiotic biosynthesis monooxygenase
MTQRATTSLSLHYQVKPGQREQVLVEIKGTRDRCAKEPEFIMAIIHEAPERPNEFLFYELWKRNTRGVLRDPGDEALPKGPISKTPRNFSTR